MLGLGRALGETIAVFFVLKIVFDINFFNIIESGGGSVATLIVSKFGETSGDFEVDVLLAAWFLPFPHDPCGQHAGEPYCSTHRTAKVMTTLMSEAPEIREQDLVPQRPWSKRPTSFWLAALLGTAVPLSFAGVLYFTTEIAAPLLLIVVYLPLQLVSAGVAGYVAKGKHGILDSGLIVFAIGSTILSAVILGVHARNDYCSGF